MTAGLDIQVLGPMRVQVDEREVELGPARRRALLAALAIEPGRVVTLDQLADRVWDGSPPANPAPTVHAYVSRLRASLRSPGGSAAGTGSPLRTRSPGYLLDLSRRALDATRFADDVSAARARFASGDATGARELVRGALSLWRGAPYADVSTGFARREADRLTALRLDACELAAQVDLSLGRHEALVAEVGALVADEPLREGLQATYLLALYRSGRQAEALHHYVQIRAVMADELGIDPGPALQALHEAILRHDPEIAAPSSAGAADLEPDGASAVGAGGRDGAGGSASPGAGPPIVGRDRELDRLRAALDRADAGAVASVALVGEAGIGKSRMLEEVADAAAARGALVAWGRCWQHEGAPVLWPWLQALESSSEQLDPAVVTEALRGRGAGVTSLVPGLAGRGADNSPAARVEVAQVRLYAAVTGFLEVASSHQTIVLLLEDMHWADAASRELVEYLVTHVRAARVALVMSVRSHTDDTARVGSELLTVLARSGRSERIDLFGLDATAVADYVADRTGSRPDVATASALAERTGGNPFFVGELVRLLVTDVVDDDGTELASAVPDSIRDVIARRLERLSADDRTVLRVAAVVGRTFDLALIESACDLGEDEVDEAVDRATELGIICSEPAYVGRHRFVHALIQQTLLDLTGPARVRRIHGRVAQALEDRGVDLAAEPAERLAFHLASCGGAAEAERAVDISLAASDHALALGNFPESEALLLRALDLAARIPGDPGLRRETSTRVRLWSLYTGVHGPGAPAAAAQHERTVELIRRYGGSREVLAGQVATFTGLIVADDLANVTRHVDEMAATAEAADDDPMRVAALMARGQELVHRGRPREALEQYAAIVTLGPEALRALPLGVFAVKPVCSIALWRSIAEIATGDHAAALASAAELESHFPRATATTLGYGHLMLGVLHALRDAPEQALHHARLAGHEATTHGFVESVPFIRTVQAWATERLEPGAGMGELDAARTELRRLPGVALRPLWCGLGARVRLDAGDLVGAADDLAEAEAAQEATGDHFYAAALHLLRSRLLTSTAGDPQEAEDQREAAIRVALDQGAHLFLPASTP